MIRFLYKTIILIYKSLGKKLVKKTTKLPAKKKPPKKIKSKPREKKAKLPAGRPTKYTKKIADEIWSQIIIGRSLRTICASDSMPCVATVFNWFQEKTGFLEQYRDAKESQIDALGEELLDIADDSANDYMDKERPDGSKYEALNAENINRSRLRVHTRQWLMERLRPKVYGPRVHNEHSGEVSLITTALEKARNRAKKARRE